MVKECKKMYGKKMRTRVVKRGDGFFCSRKVMKKMRLDRYERIMVKNLRAHISKPKIFPKIVHSIYGSGPEAEG
jgi:hypothetical protein